MPSHLGPSGDERRGGDSDVGLSDAPSFATTVSSPRDPCISCTTVGTTRTRYSYQGAYNADIRCERVPVDLVILPILGIEWPSFQSFKAKRRCKCAGRPRFRGAGRRLHPVAPGVEFWGVGSTVACLLLEHGAD